MIKIDYKIGDKIISIKPGLLNGLEGYVLFNYEDKVERQLSVNCSGYGIWNLSYDEVIPAEKESALQVTKLPFETEEKPKQRKLNMQTVGVSTVIKEVGTENSIENLEFATGKQKRPYNRKPKNEPIKEKRKYTKRK